MGCIIAILRFTLEWQSWDADHAIVVVVVQKDVRYCFAVIHVLVVEEELKTRRWSWYYYDYCYCWWDGCYQWKTADEWIN